MAPRPEPFQVSRVTIAIDGSVPSAGALEVGIEVARRYLAKVVLVSVVPVREEFGRHPDLAGPLIDRLRVDAKEALAAAHGRVAAAGLDAEEVLLAGHPAEELVRFVSRERSDLIVLGSRGLDAARTELLGSVSYRVAHLAPTSVLIVRGRRPMRKILVPVDGSVASLRAAAWATETAKEDRGAVTLLFVIPKGSEEVKFTVTRGIGEPFLGPLEREMKERNVRAERRVEYGRPADAIVRIARDGAYDLIVLGPHGRGAGGSPVVGGVTSHVLQYAPCSTLVVR